MFTRRSMLTLVAVSLGCGGGSSTPPPGGDADSVGDTANDAAANPDAELELDAPPRDADADAAGPTVPLISEALQGRCTGAQQHGVGITPGNALKRVTLDGYPDAVCNDGSPAIMYVRAAHDVASESRWLFHLQGGGGCYGYEECFDRWCSIGAFKRSKMTSSLAPNGMKDVGLLARDGVAPFGNPNQVWVYYCSSDGHNGQGDDVVFTHPEDPDRQYRLHFRGHTIVEAVVDALKQGVTSDDGSEVLPSLDTATLVAFTGTSAGSAGVLHNVDWFATQLPSDAQLVAVFDASFSPDESTITDPDIQNVLATQDFSVGWAEGRRTVKGFFDQSCLQLHADDPWQCTRGGHVRLHHITTPYFARHDLLDPLTSGQLEALGATTAEIATWTRATLVLARDIPATAEEAAAITRAPGVFSQACGQHVGLTNHNYTFEASLEDQDGVEHTFHQSLVRWMTGEDVSLIDTLPKAASTFCPPTTGAVD